MNLKRFSLLTLFAGVIFSIIGVVVPIIILQNFSFQNSAVGIIGGADRPSYEFVVFGILKGWPFVEILFGITLIVCALFCLRFSKTVINNCTIKTSALSLGTSAIGAAGLVCVSLWFSIVSFGEMSKHPIEYFGSIFVGILCFVAFVVLIALYFKARKTNWSVKGLIIDILTSIIYLPTFFFTFLNLCNTFS